MDGSIEAREKELALREERLALREAELAQRDSEESGYVQDRGYRRTMVVFGLVALAALAAIFNNLKGADQVNAAGGYAYTSSQEAGLDSGGSGGCGAAGVSFTLEQAQQWGLAYYIQRYGDKDVTAQSEDLGCHKQVNVFKNGELVEKLAVRGENDVQELY